MNRMAWVGAAAVAAMMVPAVAVAEDVNPGPALDAAVAVLAGAPHQSNLEFGVRATLGTETQDTRISIADVVQDTTHFRGTVTAGGKVTRYVGVDGKLYETVPGERTVVKPGVAGGEWTGVVPTSFQRLPKSSSLTSWVVVAGETAPRTRYRATLVPDVARTMFGELMGTDTEAKAITAAARFSRSTVDVVLDATNGQLVETDVDLDVAISKDVVGPILGVSADKAPALTMSIRSKFTPKKVGYAVAPIVAPKGAITEAQAASDAKARSLLRNSAIALESHYADNQSFAGATPATLAKIEPTIKWRAIPTALTSKSQVQLTLSSRRDGYSLRTKSASGATFIYVRDALARVKRICRLPNGTSCGKW